MQSDVWPTDPYYTREVLRAWIVHETQLCLGLMHIVPSNPTSSGQWPGKTLTPQARHGGLHQVCIPILWLASNAKAGEQKIA